MPIGVPFEAGHLGGEERPVVQIEVLPDALAVLEDLGRVGVLLGRHVAGLFEEGEVDHRRGVALSARVAIPVPGAAEVASLLDDPDVVDAGLVQHRAGDQAREASADEGNGDVIGQGLSLFDLDIGVFEVVGELADRLDVLLVAVRA